MFNNDRCEFYFKLKEHLKPPNFWVTDFLSQRLMDVEITFFSGEEANAATVARCAEYCDELLRLDHPDALTNEERFARCTIPESAKQQVRELLALSASPASSSASSDQAHAAVASFLQLMFTRDAE